MPNFLYTIILISGLSWFGWYKVLVNKTPDNMLNIAGFLILTFVSIMFSLSVPLYFVYIKRSNFFIEKKIVYRKALKVGGIIALLITSFLAYRAFF